MMFSCRWMLVVVLVIVGLLNMDRPARSQEAEVLPARASRRLGSTQFRHGSRILCLAYSPDGAVLAAGGGHDALRLWNARTGQVRLQLNDPWVQALAFVPSGKMLVTAGALKSVHLWNCDDGKEIARLDSHTAAVKALCLSSDGEIMATGDALGKVHLWELRSRSPVHKLAAHDDEVTALVLTPESELLISAGSDRRIHVWDLGDEYKKLRSLDGGCCVLALALSADGKHLYSAGDDGLIRRWLLPAGRLSATYEGQQASIVSLQLSRDGSTLISGAQDGSIRIWSAANGTVLRTIQGDPSDSDALALAPDGKSVAVAGLNQTIRRYDVAGGKEIEPVPGPRAPLGSLALVPAGPWVFAASVGRIYQWQAHTGKLLRDWAAGTSSSDTILAVAPDGQTLASAGATITLWDPASGARKGELPGREGDVALALRFAPDGRHLAVGRRSHQVEIWDIDRGKLLHTLPHPAPVYAIAYSPKGDIVVAGGGNKISFFDAEAGRQLKVMDSNKDGPPAHQPLVAALAFAPDGKTLAVSCYDGVIHLVDVASGKEVRACQGHVSVPYAIAFSRDGRLLASASFDRTVRLWEAFSGASVLTLAGHVGPVHGVALSLDERTLYSAAADTTVLAWDIPGFGSAAPPPLAGKDLEAAWLDLASEDTTRAYRAVWRLIAAAPEALPVLARKAYLLDPERVRQLFKDLNSENYAVRAVAMKRLHEYGRWMEGRLQASLKSPPSLEAKRRSEQLLKEMNATGALSLQQERLRMHRLMLILEQVADMQALQLFRSLAEKAPEEDLQEEARASLQRLTRRR
jgi:WD40 repeat protein